MRLTNFLFLVAISLCIGMWITPEQPSVITTVIAAENAVSKDEAAQIASKQTGGQVLNVETKQADGQTTHFVKVLLENGQIKIIPVSARNGSVGK